MVDRDSPKVLVGVRFPPPLQKEKLRPRPGLEPLNLGQRYGTGGPYHLSRLLNFPARVATVIKL